MIYILSWTTKKHKKILSIPLNSKLKKIRTLLSEVGTDNTISTIAYPVCKHCQPMRSNLMVKNCESAVL